MKLNKRIVTLLIISFSILTIGFFRVSGYWQNNKCNKENSIIKTNLMKNENTYKKGENINPFSTNKTAEPIKGQGDDNQDRKYAISLNATYNGIEAIVENKPKDIILILDKSSSMVWNMNYLPINKIIKCNNQQEVHKVIDDYIDEKINNKYEDYKELCRKLGDETTLEYKFKNGITQKYGQYIQNDNCDYYKYYYERIGEEIWRRSSGVNLIKAVKSFSDTVLSQKGNQINLIEFSQQTFKLEYMYKRFCYYHKKAVVFLSKNKEKNSIGDIYSYDGKLIQSNVEDSEVESLGSETRVYVSEYEGEKVIIDPWSSEDYRDEYNIYTKGYVYDLYGNSKHKIINIRKNIINNEWCVNEGTITDAKCLGRDLNGKKDIDKILDDVSWGGGTDTQSSIRLLGEELKRLKQKNNGKSKYVIFFTDGMPTGRLYKSMYPEGDEPKDSKPCIVDAVDEFNKVYNENKDEDVKYISLGFSNVPIGTEEKDRDLQIEEASKLLGALGKDNKEFLEKYCEENSNVVYIDGENQSSGDIIKNIFGAIANKIIEQIDDVSINDYVPSDKFEIITSKSGNPIDKDGNEIKDAIVKTVYLDKNENEVDIGEEVNIDKNIKKTYKISWKNQKFKKGVCKKWSFQIKAKDDYIGGSKVETNVGAYIEFENPLNKETEKQKFPIPKVYVEPLKIGNLTEVGTIEATNPVSFYKGQNFNINLPDKTLSKLYFKIKLSKGEHNININLEDLVNKNKIDTNTFMKIYEANNNMTELNKIKASVEFDNKYKVFDVKNFKCESEGEYYFVFDLKLDEDNDMYIKEYILEMTKDKSKTKECKEKINIRRNEIDEDGYNLYVKVDNSPKIQLVKVKLSMLPDVV